MLLRIRPVLSLLMSISLISPIAGVRVATAQDQMTMVIGRPNIWSLGQAHYLLANLRDSNRGLTITSPTLDPNSINGARMNVLRTLIGAEAQVSTPQALQNRVAQQQFQADFARKQTAIARLDELSRDYLGAIKEISEIDIALAALGPKPEDEQVAETERKRDELTKQKEAKVVLRDVIAGEITTIKEIANKDVTLSNLKDSLALGAPNGASLPSEGIGDIKQLVEKMLADGIPNADASQRLDNYINMQYELIAKQLTLLRDEIKSDERLLFLELPSSLYTVPDRDNNKMVHVEWTISEMAKRCKNRVDAASKAGLDVETLKEAVFDAQKWAADLLGKSLTDRQRPPITDEYMARFFELKENVVYQSLTPHAIYAEAFNSLNEAQKKVVELKPESDQLTRLDKLGRIGFKEPLDKAKSTLVEQIQKFTQLDESERRKIKELSDMVVSYPELLFIGWAQTGSKAETSLLKTEAQAPKKDQTPSAAQPARPVSCQPSATDPKSEFRVIDIIPRQSALNVNDVHATQKGWALTAKFLSLVGFGAEVAYQRQRSIYDQFLNQEVFASGFGKGTDRFGWTIGPVPGTKRLAPGPRTTFAIVAIPKDAWQITLQATAVAFPRTKDPRDEKARRILTPNQQPVFFDMMVPSERTDGFYVTSVDYTPVRKGQRVTVILGGYFSPLTGVVVDGVPLKRAVAIAKHESDSTTLTTAVDSPGEYEYLNSRQMIISFAMADSDFVGTPLITLITPEKSGAINFYYHPMRINGVPNESLQQHSVIEPMFLDGFSVARVDIPQYSTAAAGASLTVRLYGSGFRRGAQICVNDDCGIVPRLKSAGLYEFARLKPNAQEVWTVTYRRGQEMGSATFDPAVHGKKSQAPTIESIENPTTGRADGLATGGYIVVIRGSNLQNVDTVSFGNNEGKIRSPRHPNVLLVRVPAAKVGAVQVFLHESVGGETNILDFMTAGKAIFKYVKPEKPAKPKPQPEPKPTTPPKR